jgi:hypothetical protein
LPLERGDELGLLIAAQDERLNALYFLGAVQVYPNLIVPQGPGKSLFERDRIRIDWKMNYDPI